MPTLAERKQELSRLQKALTLGPIDPAVPAGKELYLPFHEQPGEPRGSDPMADLKATIELTADGSTSQLFSGFQGSGKSTELHRLALDLKDIGFPVIFIRGGEVLNLHQPLEPSDLLLSVAAAVGLHLDAALGSNPAKHTLFERLTEFFASIRLREVELGLGVDLGLADIGKVNATLGKLKLELKENPSFKSRVQSTLRGTFHQFLDAFRRLMAEARKLLGIKKDGRSPVLIIDDLEKIAGLGMEQDVVQKGMEQIFWAFHHALKIEGWHCIWTAPPYLQLLNSAVPHNYDGCVVLPMIRLWDNDTERTPNEHGLDAARKCLRLRGKVITGNIDSLFMDERLLDELILISSGHLRDLVRLMQDVVREVYKRDPSKPLNEVAVRRVIDDYVTDGQKGVYSNDLPWLRDLAERRQVVGVLSDASLIPRASKLIDTAVIMTYRNGEEWFDVSAPVRRLLAR